MILSASFITFGSFARKYLISADGIYMTMFVCFIGGSIMMWWIVSISSFERITPISWRAIYLYELFWDYLHKYYFL